MSVSQSKKTPASAPQAVSWSLEVVRGHAIGREYPLEPGESVIGNALNGARGLDLLDQEGNSPRKMAGRHAALTATGQELTIRDLDSPGGTFVNQQRLLAGQARRLAAGDVVQLGSVQIRVKQAVAAPAAVPVAGPPKTKPATAPAAPRPAVPVAGPPKTKSATAPSAPLAPRPPTPTNASAPAIKPAVSAASQTATSASPAPAAAAVPGRLSTPFVLAGGAQCRSWDDFLVLAAQDWPALRVELTSGRLAEFLRRVQRPDLVPLAGSSRSADDQLDDWLARIPANAASAPELDVHPETLLVRAASGGGITQQTLRVTNVGYRLLRWSARVDPPATSWLRLRPEHDGRPFQTIDQTDLPLELELPETIDRTLIAQIVIESNGGTRRVGVRVERPGESVVIGDSGNAGFALPAVGRSRVSQLIAGVRPVARFVIGCAFALVLRALAMLANLLPIGVAAASLTEPRLISLGLMLAAMGTIAGLAVASWRGELRDFPAAAVAGSLLGLLASAVWFAVLRSIEPMLGSWASSGWAIGLVSAVLGVVLAFVSLWAVPYRSPDPEAAP